MNLNDYKLWTALITPMNRDGSVNYSDLEKLVRMQEEAGNGILLAGSTGEGLALRSGEKREIVRFVMDLNPAVPVMAGVGGFDLEAQKEWISYCNTVKVNAFLLVTPLYAKPGAVGQTYWFQALLDEAQAPCMVYNIPARTGIKLPLSTLKTISTHSSFWSVKEASGSIDDFQSYRKECPGVPLYSGDDALMPYFSVAGCAGLVSVASNVWPHAVKRYTDLCLSGETSSVFPLWNDAIKALFKAPNPVPAKKLLSMKGIISEPVLRPPLTADEMENTDELLQADKDIENWYNENR
jgi:4-hydroxy-tetrahydrodipicolinate synthase